MVPKRARVWRAGKDFYLPARHSDGELACDQQMLNAVSKYLSLQEAEKAVAQIRQQREHDETDVQGAKRAVSTKLTTVVIKNDIQLSRYVYIYIYVHLRTYINTNIRIRGG